MKAGIIATIGLFLMGLVSAPSQASAAHRPHHHAHHRFHGHQHALAVPAGEGVVAIRDLIAKHAAANGVPFKLADAVVRIESRYRPQAANGGAVGLMQIKPATARGVGFSGSARQLFAAETNLEYGMRYLSRAYQAADGDLCGTVARYQSGLFAGRINGANRVYCARARAIIASN
jgi:soluble lytic murein transglycosylase-like protein